MGGISLSVHGHIHICIQHFLNSGGVKNFRCSLGSIINYQYFLGTTINSLITSGILPLRPPIPGCLLFGLFSLNLYCSRTSEEETIREWSFCLLFRGCVFQRCSLLMTQAIVLITCNKSL